MTVTRPKRATAGPRAGVEEYPGADGIPPRIAPRAGAYAALRAVVRNKGAPGVDGPVDLVKITALVA